MALVCSTGGGSCCLQRAQVRGVAPSSGPIPLLSISWRKDGGGRRGSALIVCARKGLSSRTRRLDNRGKKGGATTTAPKEEELGGEVDDSLPSSAEGELLGTDGASSVSTPIPDLPGLTTDFWEGSKWDTFGFIVQYLWAFGIVFALIACGIAVATYNEGATDFKETPVFKESMQSQELLEEPDSSGSDVFEVNPTEVAPSLE
ncbi:unnamed protein product [Spirodela intermedia]|uniref:Uncharacterized protein n=1 Tax=Spirodela intermedia TaxID=51605 RepID=A0A7I8KBS1_SPIIN|nr:unnamed protein product [Spirodela intermedia]